ncbi:MAG TPA: proton-conducting transporter membrane subunit [Chitinispirillaceae bacterium]|nr:proton-conducting transporter membrane subunit [Chitinispirillaceae bacterium]
MVSLYLVLGAIVLLAISGIPALFFSAKSRIGQLVTTTLVVMGSLCGIAGLVRNGAGQAALQLQWALPWGQFSVKVDALGAVFLLLVFIIPLLGSIYSLEYWNQSKHTENGKRLGIFYGLLAAGMAMVVIANNTILFLIAWEIMALAAFFAATAEDDNSSVRQAGWVYLIATHIGTLLLFALFILWNQYTGTTELNPVTSMSSKAAGTLFLLALTGFGFKAGIMPLHVWLPGAHANAPSHVSALMSGVMLKMGIYGIVRITSLIPVTDAWWGTVLLITGIVSGIAGIAFAVSQNDIKRMLAYSSIENIGIICIALGLALIGRNQGRTDLVVLGLGGALLHVLNHGFFKSLLFFNAGAIIHAVHTRDINLMGGLAKKMPVTSLLFISGAIAICALPPLNGFVSEWLIYIGLFRTIPQGMGDNLSFAALGAVALATIGPLAIASFVKLAGTVFLGNPRNEAHVHEQDPGPSMIIPMVFLAFICLLIGVYPYFTLSFINNAVMVWIGTKQDMSIVMAGIAPIKWISIASAALLLMIVMLVVIFRLWKKGESVAGTWDCGYAQPTNKMQYTGSSFGNSLVKLFSFILWPAEQQPGLSGAFPHRSGFKNVVTDTILDRLILPLFRIAGHYLPMVRVFQGGQTHTYVLYILIIIVILLFLGI